MPVFIIVFLIGVAWALLMVHDANDRAAKALERSKKLKP